MKVNAESQIYFVVAFLNADDYNVITIDWYIHQSLAGTGTYDDVVEVVTEVGVFVSEMVDFLVENGMNPNTTTLIGHSLGAHVVGIAGFHSKSKINHIVGKCMQSFNEFNIKLCFVNIILIMHFQPIP